MLREAGVRLPGAMGNTIGIVGGLIIGQAAVDANIVSPMVVIVVAFTASVPLRFRMKTSQRHFGSSNLLSSASVRHWGSTDF
ncbi:MAG: spore germination protein [Eubacterium sp.]